MAITIVMGVPGAGKSTVLEAIKSNPKCRLVNYGDLMFEIAAKEKLASHRDELRRLSPGKQLELQSKVASALSKMGGKVVLDTHCSIATPKGYLPGLPFHVISQLKVEQLILIVAPVEEIIARRKNDTSRQRDYDSISSLKAHEEWNKFLLATYSALCGAPAKIIVNSNGKLKEAQEELLSTLG
ncbi:MAG: adenylate kinase [Candidatus Micrarchaeota archaeon]|nr:adenylate kinase [Candidatus Micrarchaeota archaeon]